MYCNLLQFLFPLITSVHVDHMCNRRKIFSSETANYTFVAVSFSIASSKSFLSVSLQSITIPTSLHMCNEVLPAVIQVSQSGVAVGLAFA